MPTQLEDVSNTVSQEKISNSRLRNEEIRREMYKPWAEKVETTSTGTQPTTPVNTSGTLASIYGGLKKNADSLGLTSPSSTSSYKSSSSSYEPSSGRMPTWAPQLVGTGMSLAGLGQYGGLGAAATNFAGGNTAAGAGGLASWLTSKTPIGQYTGVPGLVGAVTAGLISGDSWGDIGNRAIDSAATSALGKAIPQFGLANLAIQGGTSLYNAATDNNYGYSMMRGLSDLFNGGTVANNGFFKNFSLGNWAQPITSGNENYSPYGGAGYDAPRKAPIAVAGPTGTEVTYIPTTFDSLMSGGEGYMANDGSYAYGSSNGTYSGYAPSGGYFSSGNSNYSPYGGSGYSSNSDSSSDSGGD